MSKYDSMQNFICQHLMEESEFTVDIFTLNIKYQLFPLNK